MTTIKQSDKKRIRPGYEPIEGYVLEKRIGSGGYGEVWRAEAPGGLKKAVKFVYGQHDERRATQELKSLERIKGIQHPFILTLERFELIENQLVIVTELADGSLEELFEQHRERGSCGIPRDKLLGYMKDAADALDYLHQLYKLQHLDIKPGNLLIVGGHVKVADFGLLKDLGEVECSLVGGLTPIYAPPEVFDGRPSIHSDQYSLAVMYQELLTNTRPFSGRTIAQLATQHVHNAPNLNPLPACDRPCVARALEKSPDRRFESCTAFVERLMNPRRTTNTEVIDKPESKQHASGTVVDLPELGQSDSADQETAQTHALVIALGGAGADCLNGIRQRLEPLGIASPFKLHSVLIDTDAATTQTAMFREATDNISRSHVVHAQLRTAHQYRQSGTERLKSISRRWIYNIPRNQLTGGMRPLGRLALVDHGQQVMKTLEAAVEELNQAAENGAKARVYVVGSITGGTASGMYIDIAYLLRHALDSCELENLSILSFLMTNRFQGDPSRPLALHATKSAISEISFFLKPENSYPGDPGAGWPSVPAARTPLRDAYLVVPSDANRAPDTVESVVNYIWNDSAACASWLDRGRENQSEGIAVPVIRSMNAIQIGDPNGRQSDLFAQSIVQQLLLRWLGNPKTSRKRAQDLSQRIIRRCYLDQQSISNLTLQWIGHTDADRRTELLEQLKTLDPSQLGSENAVRSHVVKWLSGRLDSDQTEVAADQVVTQLQREISLRLQDAQADFSVVLSALAELRDHSSKLRDSLLDSAESQLQLLEQSSSKGDGSEANILPSGPLSRLRRSAEIGEQLLGVFAVRVASTVVTRIDEQIESLRDRYSDASAKIAQAIKYNSDHSSKAVNPLDAFQEYEQQVTRPAVKELHELAAPTHHPHLIGNPQSIDPIAFVRGLTSLAERPVAKYFTAPGQPGKSSCDSGNSSDGETNATTALHSAAVDSNGMPLDDDWETGSSSGETTSSESHSSKRPLSRTAALNKELEYARTAVTETQDLGGNSMSTCLPLETAISAAQPTLLECGGQQRRYLICRDGFEEEELKSQLHDAQDVAFTTIRERDALPMLIHEAQGIELRGIIGWLESLTGDDGKISDRLASRCDIEWKK